MTYAALMELGTTAENCDEIQLFHSVIVIFVYASD